MYSSSVSILIIYTQVNLSSPIDFISQNSVATEFSKIIFNFNWTCMESWLLKYSTIFSVYIYNTAGGYWQNQLNNLKYDLDFIWRDGSTVNSNNTDEHQTTAVWFPVPIQQVTAFLSLQSQRFHCQRYLSCLVLQANSPKETHRDLHSL